MADRTERERAGEFCAARLGVSMSVAVIERESSGAERSSLRTAVVAAGADWSGGQLQLVRLVTQLEDSGEWRADGATTCAHWVARALDIEVCTVREWLRIGRALVGLPAVDAAFANAQLSYSKVRTLTRVATSENEAELCEIAERVPAGRLRHALAKWLQRHESPEDTDARHRAARGLWWHLDVDGMLAGGFRLPPDCGAAITHAVDAAVVGGSATHASADASGDDVRWPTLGQQRADALVDLVTGGGSVVVTEVVMHVRGDGCALDDGTPIADSVIERIAPDSFLRALIHDAEARPINASGRQRHPTDRQRRVVRERDGACVDCGGTELLQYDHEPDYVQSRRTLVDELKLRCWRCHRDRHRKQRREG
jgi:Domain of unknown function (DUF222)